MDNPVPEGAPMPPPPPRVEIAPVPATREEPVEAGPGWATLARRDHAPVPAPRARPRTADRPAAPPESPRAPAPAQPPSVVIDQIQVITPPAAPPAADPLASLESQRSRHLRSAR
jgi:hypothetical protein